MRTKTLCRHCKREFKFNGNAFGFCSEDCRNKHKKNCEPTKLFPNLNKELNKVALVEGK